MAYFNTDAQIRHIALIACMVHTDDLLTYKQVSEDNKERLKKCKELINEFNNEVFERFGEDYRQKLIRKINENELTLKSIYSADVKKSKEQLFYSKIENDIIENYRMIRCFECNDNWKNCDYYKYYDYKEIQGESDNDICPFRIGGFADEQLDGQLEIGDLDYE